MVFLGLAISGSGQAQQPVPSLQPFGCVEDQHICWYIDSAGELQGAANTSELGMGFAMAQGHLEFLRSVDAPTLARARAQYARIRDTLNRRWTVAARMMVSDTIHANLNTLALTISQVVTEWNTQVRARIDRDIDSRNNVISGVVMTGISATAFSLPGGVLLQCVVMQILSRGVLPLLLESNGYDFSSLPREFSSRVQGLAIDRLESDIRGATDLLLGQAGLHYLTAAQGERELREATDDQRLQVELLSSFAGTPYRQSDLGSAFRQSRDFRLLYAAKIATVLGPSYEEEINAFIVTGYFAQMGWADSGLSARGVIYDLYDVPTETHVGGPFDLLMQSRHKRRWIVNRHWQLEPEDHGSFMEGRFGPVRLILPYWDEPVVPYGEHSPVLRPPPLYSSDTLPSLN